MSASLILQNSPKEECSPPRTTQESSCPLKSTSTLEQTGVRLLFVYRLEQLALSCSPLRNCASGRLIIYNYSQSRNCATFSKCKQLRKAVHCAALIWPEMQRKCVAVVLYCALVLVGCIPTLLFTEIKCKTGSSTREVL